MFDPHAALALIVARDQVQNPAPVIAVVGELEPAAEWAETAADRFVEVDDLAAVAQADAGVEGDRILVVGAIGERAFADAGREDRAALRARFKLSGKLALVEAVRRRRRSGSRDRAALPGPEPGAARQAVRDHRRRGPVVARHAAADATRHVPPDATRPPRPAVTSPLDDELAALKQKMALAPPKTKP